MFRWLSSQTAATHPQMQLFSFMSVFPNLERPSPRGHWVVSGDICGCHTAAAQPFSVRDDPPQRVTWPPM